MLVDMMIPIKMHYKNKEHYESHGYKYKSSLIVNVWTYQINPTSHELVWVKCDYCGKYFRREFRLYLSLQTNELDNCEDCKKFKTKQTCIRKYGCENPAQNEEVKQKIKDTNMDRFGFEYSSQSQIVKDKVKKTVLEKYGYEYTLQVPEFKEKGIQTCINRYGEEHYNKTEIAKENFKKICLERYGVENPNQSEEIRNRGRATCLKIYGEDNIFKTEYFRIKNASTLMKKYGVTHYSQTQAFKDKFKMTSMKNYGVDHPLKSPEIRAKINKTLVGNYTCKTSSQQIDIYNMLKNNFEDVQINYPYSRCILDIAVFVNGIKIDVEYDGWYWHNEKNDRSRDEFLKKEGWKILRILSGEKLPTQEELFEKINSLIEINDKSFSRIVLSDWKKRPQKEDANERMFNISNK